MMQKLPKDGAVRTVWINTIVKGRNQVIQESLRTFSTAFLLGQLINPSPVFNKTTPIQWGSPNVFQVQVQYI